MPKRQKLTADRDRLPEAILRFLAARGEASTSEIARAAGVTRQAVQYHLVRLLKSGVVRRSGAGPSTRYSRTASYTKRWRIGEATEDEVWAELQREVECLADLTDAARSILNYAVTELVNNAIDHSSGAWFEISVRCSERVITIEIADDGVGAFAHLRDRLGLPDTFAAIQQLSKGKETTAPDRHTGEGIFFTSKAVDRFELESSGLRWVVDNRRNDQAVGDSPRQTGTLVRLELDRDTQRRLADVFARFTSDDSLEFDTTRPIVRLFETGGTFVSRSEAKRLATRLERFDNVIVDFEGVNEVGQGFVDELFRVWQREHPDVTLTPVNMRPAVEQMVRRGLTGQ
jgi:anti-sigma regulatory factor (Ser/Thr protein kinase)